MPFNSMILKLVEELVHSKVLTTKCENIPLNHQNPQPSFQVLRGGKCHSMCICNHLLGPHIGIKGWKQRRLSIDDNNIWPSDVGTALFRQRSHRRHRSYRRERQLPCQVEEGVQCVRQVLPPNVRRPCSLCGWLSCFSSSSCDFCSEAPKATLLKMCLIRVWSYLSEKKNISRASIHTLWWDLP